MSIQLHEVTRRFGRQVALDAVSLHVRRGDCYGFIGHNGAGKTTAMRIVLGLQRASAGQVLIDGFDARAHPREARARLGGLIEVPGFHGELDGRTNLRLFSGLQKMESPVAAEVERLLELVGLPEVGRKPVRAYSHGMKQRLGIALALLGRPAYVLLDEPINGLDPEGIAEIRTLLRRLVDEEGVTVMISSHQLHELSELCNRVGVIHRGRLVVEAETADLLRAGARRYALAAEDPGGLRAELARLGLTPTQEAGPRGGDAASRRAELLVDLGERKPAQVSRALVEAGVGLEVFAPRPPTLEEIYLETAHDEGRTRREPEGPAPVPKAPTEQRAPSHPILRVARYELARWSARWPSLSLIAVPALLGGLAILRRRAELQEAREKVALGEIFSASDVTAFEGVAVALSAGLPLLAYVIAGVASQALAGELARGTLRNVLLRPVRRAQVGLGKVLTHLVGSLGAYALLALVAVGGAAWAFGFRDLVEILPNGESFPLVPADELWPELRRALVAPLSALAAAVGVGFLAGAVSRSAAGALGLALGAMLTLDLARSVARGLGLEGWLPSAYLPSPLGDTSYLNLYADLAQGISNSTFDYADTALIVPIAWCLSTFLISLLVLARRAVP